MPNSLNTSLAFDLLIFIVKSFRDKLSKSGISVFIVARVLLKKASSLFTNRFLIGDLLIPKLSLKNLANSFCSLSFNPSMAS